MDTGIKILIVFAKSYPIKRKVGVPNNNKPTPKIDWIIIKLIMINNSNIGSIF